ncbi:hypothetical protein [Staphylococcus pettenkoferi]|nr:hypothetical protein [Staphylococcus pettenkoferi]MCY1570482.1 hypothetical protein [Staphylococcus pettenkoferi]MCY1602722.1 hypothetical protein [Staphylococcus pettenkoferi]MCY1606184.1 hypothetical protein [Staphylococcus pettenkoferi]MCY1608617.1 hypothetical protein [Staphylococcus pettenkoferi]MCY1622490.1 hypothetical protein [Staphylococcus pettenkoferi]
MKKLAKNLSLFIAFALFVTMLSGCGKSIKNKKEVTIRDIINDSETHFVYVRQEDYDDKRSQEVYRGFLTKNGKVKPIRFKKPAEVYKLSRTKGEDIEKKFKLDPSKEDGYNQWKKVRSYGEIVDENNNPLMTCIFSSKETKKSFKSGSLYPNLASDECLFYYSRAQVIPPQGTGNNNMSLGKLSTSFNKLIDTRARTRDEDPELIRRDNEDFGKSFNVVLPKKVKKIKDLDPDDKDVVTSEFEHGFLE